MGDKIAAARPVAGCIITQARKLTGNERQVTIHRPQTFGGRGKIHAVALLSQLGDKTGKLIQRGA